MNRHQRARASGPLSASNGHHWAGLFWLVSSGALTTGVLSIRPWMKDERFGEPVFGQPRDPLPSRTIVLTAPPERSLPEFGDQEAERNKRLTVGRHGVIVEVALDDLSQPFSLDRNRLMHPPTQPLFDGLQLRPHAIRPGLPFDLELAPARLAADEDKAQEAEGFRLAKPAPLAIFRRMTSELDHPGLLRVKRQRILP